MTEQRGKGFLRAVLITLLTLNCVLVSCDGLLLPAPKPSLENDLDSNMKIIFRVKVPKSVDGQIFTYSLEILDEVTGLSLNPLRYDLQNIDDNLYYVEIVGKPGQIMKYRYVKQTGIPMIETTSAEKPVRYRLFKIEYPILVDDMVAGWEDQPYIGEKGNLCGQVLTEDNHPVPALLVVAAGQRTFTDSEGRFFINDLPEGLQRISLLSTDGSMPYFQQDAVIAANSTTPARIVLHQKKLINVSFEVTLPEGEYSGIPIRIVGDLYQLGNTFSDLHGGISVVASRAPILKKLDEDRYAYSLMLPEGTYLHYKYTLGDGFWNSERSLDKNFVVRDLVVPGEDILIKDSIETWQTRDLAPITFRVTAPQNIPQGEVISIQFNPYGWMEPIPMWFLGDGQWYFTLYGPLDFVKTIQYRYCRNDICDVNGISLIRATVDSNEYSFSPGTISQTHQDDPIKWNFLHDLNNFKTDSSKDKSDRDDFILGYEIEEKYQPEWLAYWEYGFSHMQKANVDLVIFTPSNKITRTTSGGFELVDEGNLLWFDTMNAINASSSYSLTKAIFPVLNPVADEQNPIPSEFLISNLQEWFDLYRSFLLKYANLAEITGTESMILGDPNARDFLPLRDINANLGDSKLSSIIQDKWEELIREIRSRYKGKLYWAVDYSGSSTPLPEFIENMDGYYLLLDTSLLLTNGDSSIESIVEDLAYVKEYDKLMEHRLPIFIGVDIPSNTNECILDENTCDNSPEGDLSLNTGLETQLNTYRSLLDLLFEEEWITGIVSRGYFPVASLTDESSSIHGKPAEILLINWFQK